MGYALSYEVRYCMCIDIAAGDRYDSIDGLLSCDGAHHVC